MFESIQGLVTSGKRSYDRPVAARDIAVALRERLPGIGVKKLHKLLYYCQGHHLAAFNRPLFGETISAWDMGPVVPALWQEERGGVPPDEGELRSMPLGEAELNTIGYVISRYGTLTGQDLENLTHSESPWRQADESRASGASATIRPEWIRNYFLTEGNPANDEGRIHLDPEAVRVWLADAQEAPSDPTRPDGWETLRTMHADLLARVEGAGS